MRREMFPQITLDTGPTSLATLVGVRDYEIAVKVSEENLRRYGLRFDQVVPAYVHQGNRIPDKPIQQERGCRRTAVLVPRHYPVRKNHPIGLPGGYAARLHRRGDPVPEAIIPKNRLLVGVPVSTYSSHAVPS